MQSSVSSDFRHGQAYRMTNPSTKSSFSFLKRNFLHNKLDEVLRLWHRGSGQGSFFFAINDGEPSFQFAINLDFEDVSVPEPSQPGHGHHHPSHHPSAPLQSGGRRRKGPAKLAKNRQRAANFQAAKAAAAAATAADTPAPVTSFPGIGRAVGSASGPTLPLPLSKGDYFPSPPIPPTSVCTMLPSSTTTSTVAATSTVNTTAAATSFSNHVNQVMNEVLTDSDDDDDELVNSCGRCLSGYDSRSGPAYYCPMCRQYYHLACGNGHQCISFDIN